MFHISFVYKSVQFWMRNGVFSLPFLSRFLLLQFLMKNTADNGPPLFWPPASKRQHSRPQFFVLKKWDKSVISIEGSNEGPAIRRYFSSFWFSLFIISSSQTATFQLRVCFEMFSSLLLFHLPLTSSIVFVLVVVGSFRRHLCASGEDVDNEWRYLSDDRKR